MQLFNNDQNGNGFQIFFPKAIKTVRNKREPSSEKPRRTDRQRTSTHHSTRRHMLVQWESWETHCRFTLNIYYQNFWVVLSLFYYFIIEPLLESNFIFTYIINNQEFIVFSLVSQLGIGCNIFFKLLYLYKSRFINRIFVK